MPPPAVWPSTGGPDANQVVAYDLAHAAAAVETGRAMLAYGAKGDARGHASPAPTSPTPWPSWPAKLFGREADWGVEPGALDEHPRLRRHLPGPRVPRRAGRHRRAPPPRRRLRAGAGHLPPLRRQQDQPRSPSTCTAPTPTSPRTIIAGLAEMGGFGLSVPVEYGGLLRGRRERVHRHGRGHRGAVPGVARRRRVAHHPARDPDPGAAGRRHRGAEADVAAASWPPPRSWPRWPSPSPTTAPTSPA